MIRKLEHQNMGKSDLGWLQSIFHFSFAEYYNPKNMNFGVLRVINDDLIAPHTGFDMHPHKDMEIISYVVDGALTHADSMGHQQTLHRGQVQYMSAGTGIYHSEHNLGEETARLLQIWIYPEKKSVTPQYGDHRFNWDDRVGKWLHMVSHINGDAPIKIHQDVNFYVTSIPKEQKLSKDISKDRQAYLVLVEGEAKINGISLMAKDGLEIVSEAIEIESLEGAHVLLIEMSALGR